MGATVETTESGDPVGSAGETVESVDPSDSSLSGLKVVEGLTVRRSERSGDVWDVLAV